MSETPITRAEKLMSGDTSLTPITREEMFLAKAAGMDVQTPEPITRREKFLSMISGGGGGDASALDEQLAGMIGVLDGVVTGGGGYKTASGTIVLDADAEYVKVTGLEFTPISFVVSPTTVIATSTCGCAFTNGAGALFRTNTGGTKVQTIAYAHQFGEFEVLPDDTDFAAPGVNLVFLERVKVLESGFAVLYYSSDFPFRAGAEFEWWAMG